MTENNPSFKSSNPKDIVFDAQGMKHIISDGSFVKAGENLLPLCPMCTKSPMTCDNPTIRQIDVPMEPGDDPNEEILLGSRLPSGEMTEYKRTGYKSVDGVKAGIYKKLEDLPVTIICDVFVPKHLG